MKCVRVAGVLAIVIGLVATGCSIKRATLNQFVDPSFGPGTISSVAVFPIKNTRLAPSEAQQINRKISQAIHARSPGLEIMSSAEATRKLNSAGLVETWANFIDDYVTGGIPNATDLRTIGRALGVDAIMQGEIVSVQQRDGAYGYTRGSTRVTVRFSMLGTKDAKLLWESSSDGIRATATTMDVAPPVIEAITLAVDKICENLPF
ncbi:MAG: hypothetical protein IIA64_05725 [Planctomycetes bacterium]|nr:hypothetical protein [Planctomycetota bacterium]